MKSPNSLRTEINNKRRNTWSCREFEVIAGFFFPPVRNCFNRPTAFLWRGELILFILLYIYRERNIYFKGKRNGRADRHLIGEGWQRKLACCRKKNTHTQTEKAAPMEPQTLPHPKCYYRLSRVTAAPRDFLGPFRRRKGHSWVLKEFPCLLTSHVARFVWLCFLSTWGWVWSEVAEVIRGGWGGSAGGQIANLRERHAYSPPILLLE